MTADAKIRLKKEGGRYHHGNLKGALVLAAERVIGRTGNVELGLRDIAKLAGVSHAAAYRHFDSKTALLAEVAARGFSALTEALGAAVAKGRTPAAKLVELGVQYVSFAVERAGVFRAMFDASLSPLTRFPELPEAAASSLALFSGVVSAGIEDGSFRDDDEQGSVMTVWSAVHGYAWLALDGRLSGPFSIDVDDAARAARVVVKRLVEGLRAR
jgi:AcrR family transcriptional regulator